MEAQDYHAYKRRAREAVLSSYARLCAQYDAILVECGGARRRSTCVITTSLLWASAEAVDCR